MKNETKPLRNGWFVVRNRTPSEVKEGVSIQEHHQKERDFFSKKPWDEISEERRGTQALKKTLAALLCHRIQTVFPSLLKDIRTQKKQHQRCLEEMGVPRASLGQKRAYLSDIALGFHTQMMQGLQGQYASILQDAAKLRMKVRDANDIFAYEMKLRGHAVPFVERFPIKSGRVGNH